jgi:hypothetical protein
MFSRSLLVAWILLPKIFVDFHLMFDNISERGLIPIEILPITALLAVVDGEIGIIPSWSKALIRTKTIVGVPNKVDILMDRRPIDTHMARFFTFFTRHMSIDHFEVIEARIFKFLHEKINLGGEHIHLFKMVNHSSIPWSIFTINAWASSILRAKNEPPVIALLCSLTEWISPW